MSTLTKMLKNFISFKKMSHFISNFILLICSFQQCQCCECGNVSMGFWKSRVKQKSFVKSLVCDSWLNKTFVSLVISKTPYSHFLLTAFTHYSPFEARLEFGKRAGTLVISWHSLRNPKSKSWLTIQSLPVVCSHWYVHKDLGFLREAQCLYTLK